MESGHLTAWDVTDFVEGELEPCDLERVRQHLSRCPECREWVAVVVAADAPPTRKELAALEKIPRLTGMMSSGAGLINEVPAG